MLTYCRNLSTSSKVEPSIVSSHMFLIGNGFEEIRAMPSFWIMYTCCVHYYGKVFCKKLGCLQGGAAHIFFLLLYKSQICSRKQAGGHKQNKEDKNEKQIGNWGHRKNIGSINTWERTLSGENHRVIKPCIGQRKKKNLDAYSLDGLRRNI